MIITQKHLSRRTVLRGVGATVALPLLDAMVPAYAAVRKTAARPRSRFAAVYMPNGTDLARWTPAAEGPLALSPILEPLAPFRDRLLVLSGLGNEEATGNDNGPHPRAQTSWLTGARAKRSDGVDIRAGVSMDQLAAQEFGKETQLGSLELALESVDTLNGGCAPRYGYSCVYNGTLAWRTATTPLPMEVNPRAVFERLFGSGGSTDPAVRRAGLERDKSLLDAMLDKISHLEQRLGGGDRRKLDEYLHAVRDVERRIQRAEERVGTDLPLVEQPVGVPATFGEHARLMFDMLVLAYQTDMTRVSTYLLSREATTRSFPEIGVTAAWHETSHHGEDPQKLETLTRINTFNVQMLAYFLDRLRETQDGDGSLLDHTTVLFGGGLGDPNQHIPFELPTVVVGGRSANIKGGRHVRYPSKTPLANLHRTLLLRLGVPVERLGDSTGELDLVSDV